MALTNTIRQEQVKDFYIEVLAQFVSAYYDANFYTLNSLKDKNLYKAQTLYFVVNAIREDLIIVDSGCGNIYATDEATIAAFALDIYDAYSRLLYNALYACTEKSRNICKVQSEAYKTVIDAFNKIFDK